VIRPPHDSSIDKSATKFEKSKNGEERRAKGNSLENVSALTTIC